MNRGEQEDNKKRCFVLFFFFLTLSSEVKNRTEAKKELYICMNNCNGTNFGTTDEFVTRKKTFSN